MSTYGTPKVLGPLAGMFSSEAQAAIAAEEAAETLQQEQNAEQATAAASAAAVIAAETSTAATATATVEAASIDAMLGSVGLPVQQRQAHRDRFALRRLERRTSEFAHEPLPGHWRGGGGRLRPPWNGGRSWRHSIDIHPRF